MIRIIQGDVREQLRSLPAESAHTCVTSPPYFGLRSYLPDGHPDKAMEIGLEASPAYYVAKLVAVFREVRRVLRKDGTCWLVIGDSYNNSAAGNKTPSGISKKTNKRMSVDLAAYNTQRSGLIAGLKPKDLIGIPWMVAFALRADGWWLRQDIIWSKPNPMPESVTDRCTKAHEYIFLLTKSERYYYDAEAIKEAASENTHQGYSSNGAKTKLNAAEFGVRPSSFDGYRPETRNKRTVWTIATAPYSEAHFATFPPALIEPCILAGCPAKCCAKCGAPWVRETAKDCEVEQTERRCNLSRGQRLRSTSSGGYTTTLGAGVGGDFRPPVVTLGFPPSCSCDASTVAGTVLDPFGGAGTTGLVADRLQRNAILVELNAEYAAMAERRCFDDAPLFAEAAE